ncbi:MAG: N-acetyltransferase family protein [Polyangiales bacterium]
MTDRLITKPPTLDVLVPHVPANFRVRSMTKQDFDHVVQVVDHWWSGPIAILAHPMFFYELGKHAKVVDDIEKQKLVGFMLGFILPADEDRPAVGYVHLVGIEPNYRRKGVARALYTDFTATCLGAGCRRLKAITTHGNEASIRFHEALGWVAREDENYAGPGRKRVVLTKEL